MTKKILIAEDEDDLRNLIKIYLEAYDLEVIETSDGNEAVEFAKKHKPDMIITDNNMPGLTGYEVLQKIKGIDETRDIPIVMVTGKKFDQEKQMLERFGAADFIQKPYEEDKIIAVVKKVLGDIKKKSEVDTVSEEVTTVEKEVSQTVLVEESFISEEKQVLVEQVIEQQNVDQVEQQVSIQKDVEHQSKSQVTEEQPIFVEEQFSVVDQLSIEVDHPGVTNISSVDEGQSLEKDAKVKQITETEEGLQKEDTKDFLENLEQQNFVEKEKIQEQDTIVLQEQENISLETNFLEQNSAQQNILEPSLEKTLLPPDFSEVSQEVVVDQNSQQSDLQDNKAETSIISQDTEVPVVKNVEPIVEQQDEEQEIISEKELIEQKEIEKKVLDNTDEQKIHKPHNTEVEKVSIPVISQNLNSVFKEKMNKEEEKLHILDEEIYLVNKLVATSVLETLFPQKKVKLTPESKAIILIIENFVSKETLSKLNQIIETIPLMKVMINQELFNEKVAKIKSFIKKVSKEDIVQLSNALLKFFKK